MTVAETRVTAEVFVADLARVRVVALDARTGARKVATVQELAEEAGAAVAINGTFFDERRRPLGLLVRNGEERSPLRRADWGVLSVSSKGRASLVHTTEWANDTPTDFAIQCGPRVVIGGEVPKLKAQVARRSAACVLAPDSLALVATYAGIDATRFGEWLAAPPPAGLGCRDALLLDGGPSTQLHGVLDDKPVAILGGWPVPNAVGLVPR